MGLVPTTVSLPSGLSLALVDEGPRAPNAIVLLHGLTDSWRSFSRVLPRLPPNLGFVAVSQRGHGDSDKPATGYRTGDFADDLGQLLDRLDLERAVIVGHSSHGLVAQRFAIDNPSRTIGIVLESAFPTLRDDETARRFVETAVSPLRDPIDRAFVREYQSGTFLKPVPQAFIEAAVDDALKVPARVWCAGFAGLIEEDLTAELGAVGVPALLIWGDRDPLVSRDRQHRLVSGIPRAELIVYEGVGHTPDWEEPERFARDIAAFVHRLASTASGEERNSR